MHELLTTVDKERNSAWANERMRERDPTVGETSEMLNTYRGWRAGFDTVFL